MITDLIVLASLVSAAAFTVAWLISPGLRAWIERPKYRFLKDVRHYENSRSARS